MEFKIGDKVRVVNASDYVYEKEKVLVGKEYVITNITSPELLYLDITNDNLAVSALADYDCWEKTSDGKIIYCVEADAVKLVNLEYNPSEATSTNQHYMLDGIQPIEYIQKVLKNKDITPFEGGCIKDIIKYASRYGSKDEKVKEAKKIVDYGMFLLCEAMGKKVDPVRYNHKLLLNEMEKVNG